MENVKFTTKKVHAGYYYLLANNDHVGYVIKADYDHMWDSFDLDMNFVCSGDTKKETTQSFTF
jgi:hypothetical protein